MLEPSARITKIYVKKKYIKRVTKEVKADEPKEKRRD